jgi:adenylate kinase
MEGLMSNQVNILIGPPGAGKDTQAIWLAEEYETVQVPSSQIIRNKFKENPNDPIIQREKEIFDKGLLNTPELVAGWIMEFVRPYAAQGTGLTFSGSPRTPHEAEVEFPELVRLYGERNVRVIHILLSEDVARARIADRVLCEAHKHPFSASSGLVVCPKDGSQLKRRNLDDETLQDTRFKEYRELTEPCVDIARQCGVAVFEVDGLKSREAIHHDIVELVERHRMPVS